MILVSFVIFRTCRKSSLNKKFFIKCLFIFFMKVGG